VKKIFVFIFYLLSVVFAYSSKTDSLALLIKQAKTDTQKISLNIKLAEELLDINPDSAVHLLYNTSRHIKDRSSNGSNAKYQKKYTLLSQKVFNDLGYYYAITGNMDSSMYYFEKCLVIARNNNNKKHMAEIYNNLGFVANRKGDVNLALDYYINSLKLKEQYSNDADIALAYNNVASIYLKQQEYKKAIEYFDKSVQLLSKLNDERTLAIILHNLGHSYLKNGEIEQAESTLIKSKNLKIKQNLQSLLPPTLLDLGDVYINKKDYEKAQNYFNQALLISEEINNKESYTNALIRIANALYYQNKLQNALIYAKKAKIYADQLGYPELKKESALVLSRIYNQLNDYKKAFALFKEYIIYRDSIFNDELRKNTIKKQFKFEYQRKRMADSLELAKEKAVQKLLLDKQNAELENERTTKRALFVGVVLLIIIISLIVYSYTKTKNANKLIKQQKLIVEQKNEEITDSINYAKRIQDAVINRNEVNLYFPNHFVLFKPKDIVSGDFYWSKSFSDEDGNVWVHFAVADCTGHGVPGAFMSLLGISYLNELVTAQTDNPAKLLNTLRKKVIDNLKQTGEEVKVLKDGMDMSYCILNFNNNEPVNERKYQLKYAGAFNSLYIITENKELKNFDSVFTLDNYAKYLYEIKANRQSIGYIQQMTPFTEKTIQLHYKDRIYLFSDGFADQFGGDKGKKLKYKPFKNLLLSTADKPIFEQEKELEKFLVKWMKNYEQTDDITLVGIEIS
jgi:hypothetical protein